MSDFRGRCQDLAKKKGVDFEITKDPSMGFYRITADCPEGLIFDDGSDFAYDTLIEKDEIESVCKDFYGFIQGVVPI